MDYLLYMSATTSFMGEVPAPTEQYVADRDSCMGRHAFIGVWANPQKAIYLAKQLYAFFTGRAPATTMTPPAVAACFSSNLSDESSGVFSTMLVRKLGKRTPQDERSRSRGCRTANRQMWAWWTSVVYE